MKGCQLNDDTMLNLNYTTHHKNAWILKPKAICSTIWANLPSSLIFVTCCRYWNYWRTIVELYWYIAFDMNKHCFSSQFNFTPILDHILSTPELSRHSWKKCANPNTYSSNTTTLGVHWTLVPLAIWEDHWSASLYQVPADGREMMVELKDWKVFQLFVDDYIMRY